MKCGKSLVVISVVFAVAMLVMATAVQAMPVPTPAPCFNGVQDPGEGGVDCGGSCAYGQHFELCDGVDNDKDCAVDEENVCNTVTNASSGSQNKVGIAAVDVANENKEPLNSSQVNKPNGTNAAQTVGIQPTGSESLVEGIVEGTAITTEGPAPGEETVAPVQEKEPEVQEAVELKESDVDPESFLGKLLRFFKLQREEAAAQAKVEPVNNEPNPDKLQPAVEAEVVSESAPSAPSGEAAKAESSKPAEPEKKSFFSRLASIFR